MSAKSKIIKTPTWNKIMPPTVFEMDVNMISFLNPFRYTVIEFCILRLRQTVFCVRCAAYLDLQKRQRQREYYLEPSQYANPYCSVTSSCLLLLQNVALKCCWTSKFELSTVKKWSSELRGSLRAIITVAYITLKLILNQIKIAKLL